jgi:hypothetical protein
MSHVTLRANEAIKLIADDKALLCIGGGARVWTLNFKELSMTSIAGLNLGDDAHVLSFKYAVCGRHYEARSDDDLATLSPGVEGAPRNIEVVFERDDRTDAVDIKVGSDHVYHILTFSKSSPPSLHNFLTVAEDAGLNAAAEARSSKEIYVREVDGDFVNVSEEKTWRNVGFRLAVQTFEEADAKGMWSAVTVHLGQPKYVSFSSLLPLV